AGAGGWLWRPGLWKRNGGPKGVVPPRVKKKGHLRANRKRAFVEEGGSGRGRKGWGQNIYKKEVVEKGPGGYEGYRDKRALLSDQSGKAGCIGEMTQRVMQEEIDRLVRETKELEVETRR